MHIVKTQGVDGKTYKVCNGTWYYEETDDEVIEVLENARLSGTRIRIYLGDKETGRDWGEVCDVTGYVGRSMGPIKIPILLHNARSRLSTPTREMEESFTCILSITWSEIRFKLREGI